MAIELQLRRGTTAENDLFTGALAEVTVDTNKHKLRVHDGSTQGGFPVALESDITDKISNCVTEIPQDINYSISAGALTINSGSKVYVPNGSGVFNNITIPSNITSGVYGAEIMAFVTPGGTSFDVLLRDYCFSGPSAPTSFQGGLYAIWYDTNNNLVKKTADAGSTWTSGYSLPVAISHTDNSWEIFNGFGCVGTTLFILPGVKALHSAGFNSDGTLHNDVTTVQKVLVHTTPNATANQTGQLILRQDASSCQFAANAFSWQYDSQRNLFVFTVNGDDSWIDIGTYVWDGTKITNFNPKTAFHAVDYNDINVDLVVASQLPTSANNYTWYRKYKSGWVEQGGTYSWSGNGSKGPVNLPVAMSDTNYQIMMTTVGTDVDSSDTTTIYSRTTSSFNVGAYASCREMVWEVKGMAA